MKTVEHTGEMQFGRSDDTDRLEVMNLSDGSVTTAIGDTAGGRSYKLTLGQAIQLRDFLSRHIDDLALKQTGSLAVRSSDDPTQLAAVEEVPASKDQGPARDVEALLEDIRAFARQGSELTSRIDGSLVFDGHAQTDNTHACAHPHRWLQSARMDLQVGIMKLERAVKNPAKW